MGGRQGGDKPCMFAVFVMEHLDLGCTCCYSEKVTMVGKAPWPYVLEMSGWEEEIIGLMQEPKKANSGGIPLSGIRSGGET